jgi:hypothetical protein
MIHPRLLILPLVLPVALTSAHAPPPNGDPFSQSARHDLVRTFEGPVTPVPFGPGEEAKYQLKVGIFDAGEARLAVSEVEDMRGASSYRLEMDMRGSFVGFKVDDEFRSWMDTRTLASRRFARDIHEGGYDPPLRQFEIYPEERRWERTDGQEEGATISDIPLDELSFIYFLRTLPLGTGEEYTFTRYFKEDGNPVRVKVLRRERKTVPAGTFNTIVVQPMIRTSGLFSEGGEAEVYLTDDVHRHLVYLSTRIPKLPFGHITLHLTELRQGQPLN